MGTVVLIRHGERLDYVQKDWVKGADRPWDPPLTEHGRVQANLAGAAALSHLEKLGLREPTKIFSSPLVRCVETAVGVRKGILGEHLDTVPITLENGLVETICEDWYRSWGLSEHSDATWGGPRGFRTGSGFPPTLKLRPETRLPSHTLLLQEADFGGEKWKLGEQSPSTGFSPHFNIDAPEDYDHVAQRTMKAINNARLLYPDETLVFISHGGPVATMHHALSGERCRKVGFTGISILEWDKETELFKPHLASSTDHLDNSEDLGFATTS